MSCVSAPTLFSFRNLAALEEAVRMEGEASGKHYTVLILAVDIVRELHGCRLTCCKVRRAETGPSTPFPDLTWQQRAHPERQGSDCNVSHVGASTIVACAPQFVAYEHPRCREHHAQSRCGTSAGRRRCCFRRQVMLCVCDRRCALGSLPQEHRKATVCLQLSPSQAAALGVPPSSQYHIVRCEHVATASCRRRRLCV